MTNSDFRYWLRGFFDLEKDNFVLNYRQIVIISNHLALTQAVSHVLDADNEWIKAYLSNIIIALEKSQEVNFNQMTIDIKSRLYANNLEL